ncbi:hypothetical protein GOBAR_AA19832 [Gossypium barbadense]|uniref:Peroxidase n=1 Tax=Gossypium barbadense TaxID=3634 RepID=A0A2P5XBY5_GOSBA|nr:hypothetical protein GOBAR_AA19832 [Gossypium barbadense]
MMRMKIIFVLYFTILLPLALAQLKVGFYKTSCPRAESIVKAAVQKRFNTDKSITAALLRMHFHDCFVRGCDASILIDSTNQSRSEKESGPNLTVRGYELIDEAKKALEKVCPSKVSCADIITLATRDSVVLAGGPSYDVPTGRRDGRVSNMNEVNLPGPSLSVSQAFQSFKDKGLTMDDMVTLLGTGKPDPSMDAGLVTTLKGICGNGSNPTAFLDQGTSFSFDNEFYRQIRAKKGVMKIDQELADDRLSSGIVSRFASNANLFRTRFAQAMVKMGNIQVLVGNAGEIRKNSRVIN